MKKDRKRIVIALGGNVIKLSRQRGTYEEQLASIRAASHHILEFIRQGFDVVITHGNGPQVGNLLVQQEAGGSQVPAQPMHICNARSKGKVGYLPHQTLMNKLKSYNLAFNVVTMV